MQTLGNTVLMFSWKIIVFFFQAYLQYNFKILLKWQVFLNYKNVI